ncbi:MAG: glycosyltransferase family 9 protein [Chlamydiales bacterium]
MQKIALIRRNGLGDLLCAYPLVLYIRKKYPKSTISLFVDSRNYPLVSYLPPVEEVIVFPKTGNKYWNFFRTARRYQQRFEVAISMKSSPMKLMNLFLCWLEADKTIAYVENNWHGKLVNTPLLYDEKRAKNLHQALKGLHTLAPELKEIPEELFPSVRLPKRMKGVKMSLPVLLITASTTRNQSRIQVDRYAALVNRLRKRFSFEVLIMGEPKDKERASQLGARINGSYQLYIPENFEEFMRGLDLADFYFVGDGGVAHIGAALGKSELVLYGECNPIEWHPMSRKVKWLYHPQDVNFLTDEVIFQALSTSYEQAVEKS